MPPTATSPTDRWFPLRRPNPAARARLVCFPFAGGAASSFHGWSAALPAEVELCAVQLPGRERRLTEPPLRDVASVLQALEPALAPLLDRPLVLFGYSLGARLAFELARQLQARGSPLLRGLVAAAAEAPRARLPRRMDAKDDAAFLAELQRYGGTPPEVLQHRELMELLLPTLRADFTLVEAPYTPGEPLRCPLSVWAGTEDDSVSLHALEQWREETAGEYRRRDFPGGHFFLRSAREQVLTALHEELRRLVPELNP